MHINRLRLGTTAPTTLLLGTVPVERAYVGATLVYGEYDPYHSVYSDASPGEMGVYDDGQTISVASSFYRNSALTDGWRVVGARLYIPSGLLASLPATATVFWWPADFDEPAGLSTRTYAESRVLTLTAGWNEVLWITPYALGLGGVERAWVGYSFGNGQYLHVDSTLPETIAASDGSDIQFANVGDGFMSRSAYSFPTHDGESNNPFGVDIIFDEGE